MARDYQDFGVCGARFLEHAECVGRICAFFRMQHLENDAHAAGGIGLLDTFLGSLCQKTEMGIERGVALLLRDPGLICRRGESAGKSEQEHAGGRDTDPVAAGELTCTVGKTIRLSEYQVAA